MSELARVDCEALQRRSAGRFPGFVGAEVTAVERDRVRMRLVLRPEHMAPNGYLHAGVLVTLADTACGYGALAQLPQGTDNFTTIELKSNFLGTAREGALTCEATPVHLGRSTQVWDAEVKSEASGQRLAVFRCTQIVLWPRS
jgi:1,4-dihydroxy-2-naphthoyl-CoA hydrolase